ncbi:hemagglutinin repeat-containing protein [Pelagibacterium halotolerans]|uniref:hemagglutinin repeat-containing protein n=1 Tax=Pelagibacterium halotolerans TaxID=531813 RepID=UPI00384F37D9
MRGPGYAAFQRAAQNTASSSTSTSSAGFGLSASVGMGLHGPSASIGVNASAQGSSGADQSLSHTNTQIVAGGGVSIVSGNDTTLSGAQVAGETVTADIGGDLTIESLQDTSSSNSSSSGGSIGLTLDPLSGGVGGSLSLNGSTGNGTSAWVAEQSGIFAGDAVDITVGGNTDLVGGAIVSESDALTLDTGTLTVSDLSDHDTAESVEGGLSLSGGLNQPGTPGWSVEGSASGHDKEQETRATIGEGEIVIRDTDAQEALEDAGVTETVANINRDPDLAQEITKDEESYIGLYASDTSVAAAGEIANAAITYIDELVAAGGLADEQGARVNAVLSRLEEIDPDSLALCSTSVAQGFNLFHLFIAPAYALDGCEVRFRDSLSADLSVEEYAAARAAIVAGAKEAIETTLPRIQHLADLEASGDLTYAQEIELAEKRGYLQQQMAYFELCNDAPGALRASGLVPDTQEFASYIAAAEAYRQGGDALAAHFEMFGPDQQQAMDAVRRDNPELFYALYHMQFGAPETLDAMFMLNGVGQADNLSQAERDHALTTAATLLSEELFQTGLAGLNGVGGGKAGQILAAFNLASKDLSDADRLVIAGEMAAYANAHADNVEASVSTARIVVGAIFGAAVAAEAAPAVLACFADLVCANEAAITIGEIAAGDALGTTTLAIVPAAGTLTLRKGDEIIGFMDQFTGQAKSLNEVILELPKGQRPDPASYMTQAQIDEHLALFEDGAVRFFIPRPDGTIGPEDAFVFPKSYLDKLYKETGGNMRTVEENLGLPIGYLDGAQSAIIDNPFVQMPSGREPGASELWIPGGYTSGGVPEAVLPGRFVETDVAVMTPGEMFDEL